MTRAIHVGGSPRLATPSLHINGTSVSSDGAPNGIGLPCLSTKMFLRPGSLAAGTRGERSLAPVAICPCSTPPQSALPFAPPTRLRGAPIVENGPYRSISLSLSTRHRALASLH